MTRSTLAFVSFAVAVLALFAPAQVQAKCPGATTVSGECVNPAITDALRSQAIAYTQQKLSYTAPPRLPTDDSGVLLARDWNEMLNLFTFPQLSGVPTTFRRP